MAKTGAGVIHQRRANDVDLLRNPGVAALVAPSVFVYRLKGGQMTRKGGPSRRMTLKAPTLHSPDWLPFLLFPGGIVFIVKHGGRLVDERSPFKFPFF